MSNKPHNPYKKSRENVETPNMMRFLIEQVKGLQYSLIDLSIKYDSLLKHLEKKGIIVEDEFKETLESIVKEYQEEFEKQKEKIIKETEEKVSQTTSTEIGVEVETKEEGNQ